MTTPELPPLGATLVGKYELVRVVGKGGMGVVMEARDLRLDRLVAVKMLLPHASATPEPLERFKREAQAAAQLQSPHVVRLLDVGVTPKGLPFMVMEYLEGHGLDVELALRGALPVTEAVSYVLQACEGLAEAHAHGIIHRDIKPANLFLCHEGGRRTLKVLDFGISKLHNGRPSAVTQTGLGFGTPEYVSPEQLRSARSADGRSDIWSLGVVLYQLVTGTTPFLGGTEAATFRAIESSSPRSLRSLCPDAPPGLEAAVVRALRKRPSERFASIVEFAQALTPFAPADATTSGQVALFTSLSGVPGLFDPAIEAAETPAVLRHLRGRTGNALIAFGTFGVVSLVTLLTLGVVPLRRPVSGVVLAPATRRTLASPSSAPSMLNRAANAPSTLDRATGAPSAPDRSAGAPSAPDRSAGAPSTLDRSAGTLSVPDRSAGTLSVPDRSAGTLSVPDRSAGTLSVPDRSAGTLSVPDRAEGPAPRASAEPFDIAPALPEPPPDEGASAKATDHAPPRAKTPAAPAKNGGKRPGRTDGTRAASDVYPFRL